MDQNQCGSMTYRATCYEWPRSSRPSPSSKLLLAMSLCVTLAAAGPLTAQPAAPEASSPGADTDSGSVMDAGTETPDWMARLELARTLTYIKKYDEAVEEYRKLLKERPDLEEARIEMATVLFYAERAGEAVATLDGVSLENAGSDTRLMLIDAYLGRKEYRKAEALMRSMLAKTSSEHGVRLKLAEMLSWEKRYEESLAEYRRLLQSFPGDVQVRRKYAYVLSWSGQHEAAATELKKTLQ